MNFRQSRHVLMLGASLLALSPATINPAHGAGVRQPSLLEVVTSQHRLSDEEFSAALRWAGSASSFRPANVRDVLDAIAAVPADQRQAYIDAQDTSGFKYGFTALHEVTRTGHRDMALALIGAGADVTLGVKDVSGPKTVLMAACECGAEELLEPILNAVPKDRLKAFVNVQGGNYGAALFAVIKQAPVRFVSDVGCRYLRMCRVLINAGADVTLRDCLDSTTLMMAVEYAGYECRELVKLLIDAVPEAQRHDFVHARNYSGETAGRIAARRGMPDLATYFACNF